MSEDPKQFDDVDDDDDGSVDENCRRTYVPDGTLDELARQAGVYIRQRDDGPEIEISGETDISEIQDEIEAEGKASLDGIDDEDLDESVDSIREVDSITTVAAAPLPADNSARLVDKFNDPFSKSSYVVAGVGGSAKDVQKELSSPDSLGGDFAAKFDATFPDERPTDVDDVPSVLEDDLQFHQESVGGEYVADITVDSLGVGPPLTDDVGATMPPPSMEIDRILENLEAQLEKANLAFGLAEIDFKKAERNLNRAKSTKLAIEEAIGAFYLTHKVREEDLIDLVAANDMEKVERVLRFHEGFCSAEVAVALLDRREGVKIFIEYLESFKALGVDVLQKLSEVELDMDQISSVLKILRDDEQVVFFKEGEGNEQVESFVAVFLERAERLVDRLRTRFSTEK